MSSSTAGFRAVPRARGQLRPRSASTASATHLLAARVNPKIVADRLGHHSVAFTLDTYTHVMPGQDAEAVANVLAGVESEIHSPGSTVVPCTA